MTDDIHPSGHSSVVTLFLEVPDPVHTDFHALLAIGVIVLCGVPSVSAKNEMLPYRYNLRHAVQGYDLHAQSNAFLYRFTL